MQDIKYSTKNEERMFKEIQKVIGAYDNGWIGTQTMSDIAIRLGATKGFPVTLLMYGMPTIIAKDIIAFNPKGSIAQYSNSMLGSFTYPRATTPCSILINNGQDVYSSGSKAWAGFGESVMVKYNDGSVRVVRVKTTSEIPSRRDVKVAVGGMGLLGNYNPSLEGFKTFTYNGQTFHHGDVLRKTDHNVLGYKNGMFYGVYCKSMTGSQVNALCRDRMQFEMAIMLDGGGLAAINGTEGFAKIKAHQKCGYAIQFI